MNNIPDAYMLAQAARHIRYIIPALKSLPLLGKVDDLKIPQGLSEEQFNAVSKMLKDKVGHISDDIFIQGSRASGTATPTSDIDIG